MSTALEPVSMHSAPSVALLPTYRRAKGYPCGTGTIFNWRGLGATLAFFAIGTLLVSLPILYKAGPLHELVQLIMVAVFVIADTNSG